MFMAKKPSKVKRPVGRPETDRAVVSAQGPGRAETAMPFSTHSATSSSPGSLTAGVPASETKAQLSPESNRRRMVWPPASVLWR